MKFRYLFLLPLFAVVHTKAQDLISLSSANNKGMHELSEGSVGKLMYGRGDYSSGNGITSVSFYNGLELGIVTLTGKANDSKISGTGFRYGIDIGAKIPLHLKLGYKQYIISVGLSYSDFAPKTTIDDGAGNKQKVTYGITTIGIPLSYAVSALNKAGGPIGYYWQVGANIDFFHHVKDGETDLSKSFNSMMISPAAGGGMSFTFDGAEGRVTSGTMMLGLQVAYDVTNMAKDKCVSMNTMFFGIRYVWVWT